MPRYINHDIPVTMVAKTDSVTPLFLFFVFFVCLFVCLVVVVKIHVWNLRTKLEENSSSRNCTITLP